MEISNIFSELGLTNENVDTELTLCALVYRFASNLPYSMDYKDPDFVPGDFINFNPVNPKKYLFLDYGNLYNKLIHWGDTILTGIQLQVCNIFQKMLLSNNEDKYQLTDEDYYFYGFDKLTSMELYNRSVFNLLLDLPKYSKMINACEDTEERRKSLDSVYAIISKVTSYVEKIKCTQVEVIDGIEMVREEIESYKHFWSPRADLEMMYYFNHINNYSNMPLDLVIDTVKERMLEQSNVPRLK